MCYYQMGLMMLSTSNLQVYLTLGCALVASAAGAYLHILWNIGGILTTLASIGCITWLMATPPYEEVSCFITSFLPCIFVFFVYMRSLSVCFCC